MEGTKKETNHDYLVYVLVISVLLAVIITHEDYGTVKAEKVKKESIKAKDSIKAAHKIK